MHPEPDGSALHGNVVTREGIRHIALEWSAEHELAVLGSPASLAVMLREGLRRAPVGEDRGVDVVVVDDDLDPSAGRRTIRRVGERDWELVDDEAGRTEAVRLDADGRPVLRSQLTWPLEA